ncbi:MAG: phosphate ABC transporter permease PstA [Bacteroidota bacterium]|nr:phosphate ABC transporter permease PstA [Bacteroidota bacterium]
MDRTVKYRLRKSILFKGLVILLAVICTIPLFLILGYIVKEGITRVNWHFLVNLPKPVGESGGGIANALMGSILIVFFAALIAIPFGVMSGIYLSEHKNNRLSGWIRVAVDVLQGTPSIVVGIVIYFWIVKPLNTFSALSGSVALAIMMLPIVVRSTEETLKLLPSSLKEAGLALGLPYHKVIMRIILPCGFGGVFSGIILAVARIAGETAPLLFTAFGNPYFSTNMGKPMESLPHLIFNYAMSAYDDWHNLAWGAAFILLLWVLLLNIITKISTRKWKIQF